MGEVVIANYNHAVAIATNMRKSDQQEVWYASLETPLEAVANSMAMSQGFCYTVIDDGQPIAVFGVASDDKAPELGFPWLLGTPAIKGSKYFIAISREWCDKMLAYKPTLINYVWSKNRDSIRWLRWCGFTVNEKPTAHGPFNKDFYPFGRRLV